MGELSVEEEAVGIVEPRSYEPFSLFVVILRALEASHLGIVELLDRDSGVPFGGRDLTLIL